jgi:hypothetical protein
MLRYLQIEIPVSATLEWLAVELRDVQVFSHLAPCSVKSSAIYFF